MGTRADYYIGRDESAEYLGSVAWLGGRPSGGRKETDDPIAEATTEEEFRSAVRKFIESREDGSLPERDGWPWPWESSNLTDESYWFFDGKVHHALIREWPHDQNSIKVYVPYNEAPKEDEQGELILTGYPVVKFPNMEHIQKVTFGERSGLIVIKQMKE